MSAWTLANLTVPAAEAKERRAQETELRAQQKEAREQAQHEARKNTPTPSKGNRWDGEITPEGEQALQFAINNLPLFDTQKVFFRELRDRGVAVPDDRVLRDDPLTSLYFCQMAYKIRRDEARA
ncbi:MAG: hypothetical protein ACREGR_00320, partial [Minisyncoccia bacterium]